MPAEPVSAIATSLAGEGNSPTATRMSCGFPCLTTRMTTVVPMALEETVSTTSVAVSILLAVDARDHVTGLQPGAGGGAPLGDLGHEGAFFEDCRPEPLLPPRAGSRRRRRRGPEIRIAHVPAGEQRARDSVASSMGMANPYAPPGPVLMRVLIPTTSPSRLTSGPPELPGLNHGVRLDIGPHAASRHLHVSPDVALAAHDTGRDILIETERAPDCQNPVADLEIVGVPAWRP